MDDLPFDSVLIDQGAEKQRLSSQDFMRLPLNDRIQVILERRIEFQKGGLLISRSVALQSLMATSRKS
jgi:hypothetical protein